MQTRARSQHIVTHLVSNAFFLSEDSFFAKEVSFHVSDKEVFLSLPFIPASYVLR